MNVVDIAARGLARRAQTVIDATLEGTVGIGSRSEPTAAALEALVAETGALTGFAGATHTVETAPYLRRDNLVIRGNGATLRNVNTTAWSVNDFVSAVLPLGTSNLLASYALYSDASDEIVSVEGNMIALPAGAVAARGYAVGEHYYCRGATEHAYDTTTNGVVWHWHVPRNVRRGRIVAIAGDILTLDQALPAEFVADAPKIAIIRPGAPSLIAGQDLYYLYNPRIEGLTLVSDQGEAVKLGGIVGGVLRDLRIEAVNGVVLGALERTLVENVDFLAHRKIVEIAEGSRGAVFRNFTGTLVAGSGAPSPFFIQIGESSDDCVIEGFNVSCGGLDAGAGSNAIAILSGRRNTVRKSIFDLRGHTGPLTALQAVASPGNSNDDSGFEDLVVIGDSPQQFFTVNDSGGGINRGYFRRCKYFGTPTATVTGGTRKRAGRLRGNGTVYEDLWCEKGAGEFDASLTAGIVRRCYFPDGFAGLTDAIFAANDIADNDSDANRRLQAGAKIVSGNIVQITGTAEAEYQSATFGGGGLGDLGVGDRVWVYVEASAGGAGSTNRLGRLAVIVNGVTTNLGTQLKTSAGGPMGYEGQLTVLADTGTTATLGYHFNVGGTPISGVMNVDSLVTHDLKVAVNFWCTNSADPVNTRVCRIIAIKRGMRHLPLR
jgi:hypothetical protein